MEFRRLGNSMKSIFLSASVPVDGSGRYFETADPFLIQVAVREFMTFAIGRRRVVWGGTPVNYSNDLGSVPGSWD